MRNPSIRRSCVLAVAALIAGGSASACARTLTLTAARLHDPHVSATDLRVVFDERATAGSLQISAKHIDVPQLALHGRVEWACELTRDQNDEWVCTGPAQLGTEGHVVQSANLTARISRQRIELALARDRSRVMVTLPMSTGGATSVSLQQVPAAWLKAPLAQAWKGGEVRSGVFDADVTVGTDGSVNAHYKAADLTFNTFDGTVSGASLVVAGELDWSQADTDGHFVASATATGGKIGIGAVHVALPQTPVAISLDAMVHEHGRWDISRFAWSDPDALEFDASGSITAGKLAPLRSLDVHLVRALLPLAQARYAQTVLAAQGLRDLVMRGELSGDLMIDTHGLQRIALATRRFDVSDPTVKISLTGLKGGLDWAAAGVQPPTALAWTSARIHDVTMSASASRWQSRGGALNLLGSLKIGLFGGELKLQDTILRPQSPPNESVSTAFTFSGIGYDSKDGSLAAANLAADGRVQVSGTAAQPRVQLEGNLHGGEGLVGPVYVKLPAASVKVALDATFAEDRWSIRKFDWKDPGVLDLGAVADIELADARSVKALHLDLRTAKLGSALDRYAHSWLASKGYGELTADGSLSGTLQFDAAGLQRFALDAQSVDLRDGAGRFRLTGLDGSVDWDIRADTPPSALRWKDAELFRIPLGGAHAAFESRHGQIVLAQPLAVDVLGGQVRLETLSLQPRSPRGERYAGSFAIVGIDMAQLSTAFGWPRFGGNLSGGIPEIVLTGDTIELHGGLDLYVFDGHLGVSGLTLQRPFGVAPALGADVHFERFDLDQVTQAFSFGGMSGRLDGTVADLRLLDWSPVAFDAWLRTSAGGRMSYKAVNDLTSMGGGGGLSANLQTMALKMFNTFGYRRLGLRCKLRDEVCAMAGIDQPPATGTANSGTDGYTIVQGSGIPRIDIVGHGRRVDWPTLVRRLQEATQGQGPIIK